MKIFDKDRHCEKKSKLVIDFTGRSNHNGKLSPKTIFPVYRGKRSRKISKKKFVENFR